MLGLDACPEILAVARRKHPDVEWHDERAESLPFADASFDAVVSQFGLMFFDDRVAALREMQRVLQPGGHLAVAVCDALGHSPGCASIDALVSTERACVWTLGGLLDDTQFERLRRAAQCALLLFVDADGRVAFAMPELLITATKR